MNDRLAHLLNKWSIPDIWTATWDLLRRRQIEEESATVCKDDRDIYVGCHERADRLLDIWQRETAEIFELWRMLPTKAAAEMPIASAASKPGTYTALECAAMVQHAAKKATETPAIEGDDEWYTLSEVAKGFNLYDGKGKKRRPSIVRVKRLGLPDNGKAGKEKRISRAAVGDYAVTAGILFNPEALKKVRNEEDL